MSYAQIFASYDANPYRNSAFSAAKRFEHLDKCAELRRGTRWSCMPKSYALPLARSRLQMVDACQKPRLP